MNYDVIVIGGGPAGLSAALALGIARKTVLVCDVSGSRRNIAAEHLSNFVTRDGIAPAEFRSIGRDQLKKYPSVEVQEVRVQSIGGERGAFQVTLASLAQASTGNRVVTARRIVLATGMVDEMLPIEGFRDLWGNSIFQCPYCHGWDVRDRPWGYLAAAADASMVTHFALLARGWTRDLTLYMNGATEISENDRETLSAAGVRIEMAPVARLVSSQGKLEGVELVTGATLACAALFAHPPQRQVAIVTEVGVELDEHGYVRIDPMRRETSVPGIYAAGDLTTRQQAAILGAASGMQAAAALNAELTAELVKGGAL